MPSLKKRFDERKVKKMNYQALPIRFKPEERVMLKELAARLQRSQSDTIRVLVRGALQVLKEQEAKENNPKQSTLRASQAV